MKFIAVLSTLEAWPLFERYAQFCIVGGSGLVVDMGAIWLLADPSMLAWNLTLSKVIAAEVALINNFVWNDLWTFRKVVVARTGCNHRLARFLKFNLICAAGIGLSVILMNSQVYGLGWNVYVANFIAIVLVSLWNFFLSLRLGWSNGWGQGSHRVEHIHSVRVKYRGN
jgi:dolichol-phosphate mannosyltransferase